MKKITLASVLLATAFVASGEVMDRPQGIRIGQRLVLKPYVAISSTYDSNVANYKDAAEDVLWTVSPNLGVDYRAENWILLFNCYYNYRGYSKGSHANEYSQHSYGESLRWNWSNSKGAERGWALMLSESYQRINMIDDMDIGEGQSVCGDRDQFTLQVAAQRRFNEHWHGDVHAGYNYINYENDNYSRGSQYGYQRWTAGVEAGFAPSRWTDFLLALGYQGYKQDNTSTVYQNYNDQSQGFTAQVGIGSYMTERISYRALAGWSRFNYGGDGSGTDGFVYTLSGNWKIGETWNTMLMATSYYQPSERQQTTQQRTDAFSWGLTKSLVRNKMLAKFDLVYRHEAHEHMAASGNDYDLDIVTGRLGLDYILNRYLTLFVAGEYQRSFNSQDERINTSGYYDYQRWRGTVGLRFTY